MSKSHRSLCVSFSKTGAGLCIYHLFVWSNLNSLLISQWINLPTQSCLVLYSFCANLLHSLIIWLMVSSLSPHDLHLLFCGVLSNLALIWLVLTALFCATIIIININIIIIIKISNFIAGPAKNKDLQLTTFWRNNHARKWISLQNVRRYSEWFSVAELTNISIFQIFNDLIKFPCQIFTGPFDLVGKYDTKNI